MEIKETFTKEKTAKNIAVFLIINLKRIIP